LVGFWEAIANQIELRVGLWIENDQPLNHRLGFVVFAMPESRPLDD
jgi:hypothetical protein